MIQRVLVLGGGSAGFLAAITIKARVPSIQVTVLRSKEIGVIGVGEGTTLVVPRHLHTYLGIGISDFYAAAEPQWKLGIRFLWGPRPFFDYAFDYQLDTTYALLPQTTAYYVDDQLPWDYVGIPSALMSANNVFVRQPNGAPELRDIVAYHLENEKLVAFLETQAARVGVNVREGTVREVRQDDNGITGLLLDDGQLATGDLYLDCSGFGSLLLGRTLQEPYVSYRSSLFCDRAVVGGWERTTEPIKPYTTAETMDCGWCWQIEHERRINRGYVYSSDFISDADAEAEFRRKNPLVGSTRLVKYRAGRYQRSWVKNVVAIGNAAGFVEPLEATALGVICQQCQAVAESLKESRLAPPPSLRVQYNKLIGRVNEEIRQFLAVHYRFNTRLHTPFWQACCNDADLCGAAEIVEYYREMGPSVLFRKTVIGPADIFGMEGYLSMLVGQNVPYANRHAPTQAEQENWMRIRQIIQRKGQQAWSVPDALRLVRDPRWTWPANLYHVPRGVNG